MSAPAKLEDVFATLHADLRAIRVDYAVIGGLGVGARAVERMTKDIDIAVAVGDERAAEQLVSSLAGRGYRICDMFEHGPTGRLSTVRLTSPVDDVTRVDLLFASSGIEAEIVRDSEDAIVFGKPSRVAQRAHLVAMKLLSRRDTRPQDELDLAMLLPRMTDDEIETARAAIALITERGMSRGRDLAADFTGVLTRYRP